MLPTFLIYGAATMPSTQTFVKSNFMGFSDRELLQSPPTVLIGINDTIAQVLTGLSIHTVFDLATSRLFNAASAIAQSAPSSTSAAIAQYGFAPSDQVSNGATGTPIDTLQLADISQLDGIGRQNRDQLVQALQVETIRDLSLWPPYRAALQVMNAAFNLDTFADDPDAPAELLPTAGEYATEKAYYSTIFLDEIEPLPADSEVGYAIPLSGQLDILGIDSTAGFQRPATGAMLTFEQSWYPQGLSLGQLLHSIALAPAESTKVAIIDWARQSSTDVSEAITEGERLSNSLVQNRAISETVDAVATESLRGFSSSKVTTKSGGGGGGFGFSLGPISIGGSGGGAKTVSNAVSVSSSRGRRQVSSETLQSIRNSTQQNAASVRTRRASIVREVEQSEQETLTTRTLTNYNHSHALSMHYYEVVQIYRVATQLAKYERVIFVPMRAIDFRDERVLNRYRTLLFNAAQTPYMADLILQSSSQVVFQRKLAYGSRLRDDKWLQPPDARLCKIRLLSGRSRVNAFFIYLEGSDDPVEIPVNGQSTLTLDLEPIASRIEKIQVDVDAYSGLSRSSQFSRLGLYFDFCLSSAQTNFYASFTMPDSGGRRTLLETTLPTENAELADLLNEESIYYSQAIWQNLSAEEVALLLEPYEFRDKRLIEYIDPQPLTTYGNYLVFRYNFDESGLTPDQVANLSASQRQELETWKTWVNQHVDFSKVDQQTIAMGTGGTFAEAILGRFNASEKLDITRFWDWQTSPIPFQAPDIAALQAGSRAMADDTTPSSLGAPVVNIMNPPALPDPGTAATLAALNNANLFRDATGLAATIVAAQQGLQTGSQSAQSFTELASENLKVAASLQQAAGGSSSLPAKANPSLTGALLNHGAKLDAQQAAIPTSQGGFSGVSNGAGGTPSLEAEAFRQAVNPLAGTVNAVRSLANLDGQAAGDQGSGNSGSGSSGGSSTSNANTTIAWRSDISPETRAFYPGHLQKTGTITLDAQVVNAPTGSHVKWHEQAVPGQSRKLRVKNPTAAKTDIVAIHPGVTTVTLSVYDNQGSPLAQESLEFSVPQFVKVTEVAQDFDQVLQDFGLGDTKSALYQEVRRVAEHLLRPANVRLIWTMEPFNERVPHQVPANSLTVAKIAGNPPGNIQGLFGLTYKQNAPFPGPDVPNEEIFVWPGSYDDNVNPQSADGLDDLTRKVLQKIRGLNVNDPDLKTLGYTILGRLIGETLAHEILHALLGRHVGPDGHHQPAIAGDLINSGQDRTFRDRTGIILLDLAQFPAPVSYQDTGFENMSRITETTQQLINQFFPVPPVFS
jgi:hypothetical protein